MALIIVLITVLVSLMVPKPVMFETAVVGAFLAVGCAIFSLSDAAGNLAAILIAGVCLGIPVYRLLNRN